MKLGWPVEIAGTGAAMPDNIVTNADFERRLDTSNEWIVQRTGIRERRVSDKPEHATLYFATHAARMAMERAGVSANDIDLIVCGTVTPEHPLPSNACEMQAALGCRWIPSFDLSAACSGFVYSLITASQYVATGLAKTVLVVGAETLSRITDQEDRGTAILFGDGAGAAVIRRAEKGHGEILAANMGADGARGELICIPGGGSRMPPSLQTIADRMHYMKMRGREVYKFAVSQMQALIEQTLVDAGVEARELALIVPHQSNLRIIESAIEKLNFPMDRVMINIDRYGNTSAASVPIALHEAREAGRIKSGDLVMLVAFGAGLTWASALLRL